MIELDYLILTAYKKSQKTEIINYVLLYSCILTRAVYFELMHDLSLVNLKGITARCSRPEEIFSNNFSTVQAPSKWIRQTMKGIVPSWMCYRVLNTLIKKILWHSSFFVNFPDNTSGRLLLY